MKSADATDYALLSEEQRLALDYSGNTAMTGAPITRTIADKNMKCTVCGNSTWFDEPVIEETPRDFHFHIRPSTALLLQQRKVGLGTWDSCIRQLIQGYDAYAAIVERQRFKWITGLKTMNPDIEPG